MEVRPVPTQLFTTEAHGETTQIRLHLAGTRGPEMISQLDRELTHWLSQNGGRHLVLDFSDLPSLTSDFLAKLIGWQRQIQASGGSVRLTGLNPTLLELFEITRLSRKFQIITDATSRPTGG